MAAVIESVATTSWTAASSINITKPTGLQEGETLFALIFNEEGSTAGLTPATPSGWTKYTGATANLGNRPGYGVFYKTASSADAAASNFTFTCTNTDNMCGVLYRLSGDPYYYQIDIDTGSNLTSGNAISPTKAITIPTQSAAVFAIVIGNGDSGTTTTSAYTLTGQASVTFTERLDAETANDIFVAVADGIHSASGLISAAGATLTNSIGNLINDWSHILLTVNEAQGATGTTSLITASPTIFAPTASSGTTGTTALIETNPTANNPTGTVDNFRWTNESDTTTTWTNES